MKLAFPPLTPVVRATLIVLFASFVLQTFAYAAAHVQLLDWLGLQPGIGIPTAWQWATHVLVEWPGDGAVVRRAMSLLFVYFWITPFEHEHGPRKTMALLGLSVAAGAVLPFLFALIVPSLSIPYAGASAITYAGMAALAVRTRGAPLNFVLLPTMNAWTFAAIFLVIDALQCAWMGTPTPLLGSLGGFAAGILYTRYLERPRPAKKVAPPKRRAGASHLHVIPGGQSDDERPRWLN